MLNGKTAYTYGPYVLAYTHFSKTPVSEFSDKNGSGIDFKLNSPAVGENINVLIRRENGGVIRLKDYSSCGKKSYSEKISVWLCQGIRDGMISGIRRIFSKFSSLASRLRKRKMKHGDTVSSTLMK